MKRTKKVLSVFLALLMIISIIPMSSITASAANGIQSKIDLIRTIYDTGSYFTSDGKSHNMWDYSVCPEDPNNRPMPYRTCKCSLSQQTKKTTGLYSGAEVASKTGASRWQCAAFATYVFYNIFNKDYGTCGTVSIDNAKLGDVVVFDFDKSSYSEDHYAIYLYTSGSNVYVYDANSDYNSKVVYGKSYAKSAVVKVFRASNYDSVNGSPTTSINYVTGLAGQYYLESKDTGYWLSVSESKDASTQPINTWGTWWENFRVKLVASGNGYKINFPLVSSLLMNPYSDTPSSGTKINLYQDVNDSTQWWGFEKVGDAYAIRCLYNPSLVLTSNGTAQATLTAYTGATNQLWYLHPYTTTVSYNANGGTGAPSSQTKYFNENLTLSSTVPTRSGYTFLGWSTSSTATSPTYSAGSSFVTNANTTLYAVWKANTYTVSYNANGGTGAPSSQTKYHNQNLTLSNTKPTRNGYTFAGWGTSPNDILVIYSPGETYTDNSSITLYALWSANTYTVSYNANGGTGAPPSQTKYHNTSLKLSSNIPTRSGYTFLGWSTSSTATTPTYYAGGSFTSNENTTLYAVWQKDVVEPKVHISNNNIILTLGWTESTYIYAWATDTTSSYTVQYQIADANVVGCSWGEWTSDNKCPLTITAKSKGTTTVTVSLIDYETKEVLDSVDLTVTIGVHSSYVDFSIKEPSTTTIRYKDGIVLHIDGYIPEGARVEWAVDSNAFDGGTYDNGMSCLLVSKNNGYTTVVATLYDANDSVIASDSIELRSKAGFFDKIGGFFRSLFGSTKIYDA